MSRNKNVQSPLPNTYSMKRIFHGSKAMTTLVLLSILLALGGYFVVYPGWQKHNFSQVESDLNKVEVALKQHNDYVFTATKSCARDQEKWGGGALSCTVGMTIGVAAANDEDYYNKYQVIKNAVVGSGFRVRSQSAATGSSVSEKVFTPLTDEATGYNCLLSDNSSSEKYTLRLACSHRAMRAYF